MERFHHEFKVFPIVYHQVFQLLKLRGVLLDLKKENKQKKPKPKPYDNNNVVMNCDHDLGQQTLLLDLKIVSVMRFLPCGILLMFSMNIMHVLCRPK